MEARPPARSDLTPDEIAERLERWRPRVLREMGRRRLWFDAPAAEREDQFQDVAFVLTTRPFASEEHLLRALWTGLGFRARDFWKSARRREMSVGEFFEDASVEDAASPDELAVTAADWRAASDCLSELNPREQAVYRLIRGHGLSRRKAARALGLNEAEVLRALYSAQRKIDQVSALLVSGRLCARRSGVVRALARSEAHGQQLEQARAHLSHCRSCLVAFRRYQAVLGRDIAALVPAPGAVAVDHITHVASSVTRSLRHGWASARAHAATLAGRSPRTTGGSEALIGGGAGGAALGTKLALGLCVGVAAGGSALCVQTLGLLPSGTGPPHAATRSRHAGPGHFALGPIALPPPGQSGPRPRTAVAPGPASSSRAAPTATVTQPDTLAGATSKSLWGPPPGAGSGGPPAATLGHAPPSRSETYPTEPTRAAYVHQSFPHE